MNCAPTKSDDLRGVMSIRLRLTLLFSAILALTLFVSGAILYIAVSRLTYNVREDALAEQAKTIINASEASEFQLDQVQVPTGRVTTPRTFAQTRLLDGQIVDSSDNLDDFEIPLSDEGLDALQRGEVWTEAAETEAGRVLVYNQPIRDGSEIIGIIQVARSIADYDDSLDTLRNAVIVGIGVVTLVAFGISWLLAGTALRPINRITETAQEIGEERDFSQRVEYTGPPDELGRLTTTMNVMLTELQAAFSHAERTLDAQRRFAADASHELRTPLTTIRGNLELLRRDPPISPEDHIEVVTDIIEECERLMRLVNDLMVLQRADAEWPLSSERVRIKPVIEEICRQARLIDTTRTIVCDGVGDVAIAGSRDALKQIILILLDNAIKYTPAGERVVVSATATPQWVRIAVRDSGPGIDAEMLPHIFDRFYRGDLARRGTGVGLGLAIAKALVEAQRGRIEVDTAAGEGAAFTISLPCAPTPLRNQRRAERALSERS